MHVCTDEDFENFYPIEKNSAKYVESLKQDNHWFCFNWKTTDFDIAGDWKLDPDYETIEVRLSPCASKIIAFDGSVLGG